MADVNQTAGSRSSTRGSSTSGCRTVRHESSLDRPGTPAPASEGDDLRVRRSVRPAPRRHPSDALHYRVGRMPQGWRVNCSLGRYPGGLQPTHRRPALLLVSTERPRRTSDTDAGRVRGPGRARDGVPAPAFPPGVSAGDRVRESCAVIEAPRVASCGPRRRTPGNNRQRPACGYGTASRPCHRCRRAWLPDPVCPSLGTRKSSRSSRRRPSGSAYDERAPRSGRTARSRGCAAPPPYSSLSNRCGPPASGWGRVSPAHHTVRTAV